jgi:signal transduction histidine kinase
LPNYYLFAPVGKPLKYVLLFWLCFVFANRVLATNRSDSTLRFYGIRQVSLVGELNYYIDSSGKQDFNSLGSDHFSLTIGSFTKSINHFLRPSNYWLTFSLLNNSKSLQTIFIDAGDATYMTLYEKMANGKIVIKEGGDGLEKSEKYPLIEQQVFKVILLPGQVTGFYILFPGWQGQAITYHGIGIYDHQALYNAYYSDYYQNRMERIFQLLFQGFILCQILYVVFQWFIIQRKEYLYYALYLLLIGIYYFIRYESVIGLNWPFAYHPLWYVYFHPALIILPYVLYFRFVRSFLEIPARFPLINTWVRRLEFFLLFYTAFDMLIIALRWHEQLFLSMMDIILFFIFIICVILIIYLLKKKDALIYFILTGSFFAGAGSMMGHVISFLQDDIRLLHGNIDVLWWGQVGIILEICCFTIGLSFKSRLNEKEKIKSQNILIEQMRDNEELQRRMQNIRNKIARDLHDDIGSTLSTILLYSNAAKKKAKGITGEEALQTFNQISDLAAGMMDEMSDIVWTINPKNDTPEKIFQRMYLFASPILAASNITFLFEADEMLNNEIILMNKRKNLYLIFKEAINNGVKYSGCNKIEVSISKNGNDIEMKIKDNGTGFNMDEVRKGNGLDNMQQRAREMSGEILISSVLGNGTNIHLRFPPA